MAVNVKRRGMLWAGAAFAGTAWAQQDAPKRGETALPTPASLHSAGAQAQSQCAPLVLLVSLPGCPWCELLRRNYLAPMRQEGLHAVQIMVNDRSRPVANFQGRPSTGADIAAAYQAKITPSVLFLNSQGFEIAPRMQGVASADLLGAQLDAALQTARQKLCS